MRAPSMYAGLMRLAGMAGFKLDESGNPAPSETDRDDEALNDGAPAGDAPAGDAPGGDAPAGDAPAGDTPADDSTTGDDAGGGTEDDNNGTTDDAGAGGGAGGSGGTEASGGSTRRSADFLAGERHGATQTAGRWAATLASPVARANLEMATDLLASSNMTPSAIVEHCDRYKGESSAKRLLDQTPRHNLGNGGQSVNTDEAAAVRAKSVAKVNAGTAKAGANVRKSRRTPAAGK